MNIINLRKATLQDCEKIADLHKDYIQSGFLSTLGVPLLRLLYHTIINSNNTFCIVAEEDKEVIGFVSGTGDIKSTYKHFLRRNFLKASIVLFPKFISIKTARRIFETLFYPVKKEQNLPAPELLSIVVDKNYQGQGISQKIFKELIEEFRRRGITQFKVVVGSQLIPACRFYEKMGGKLHSEIEVHKDEKSRVYVWEL
ncbi:MAG: GNAT family N-acetyltransferase [Candidatus Omnitrophica bacterium]|nr:GNAT family N-acetyltransferase [Candidatus Omnitrophota bacterium]